MYLTFDPSHDVAYIRFLNSAGQELETIRVSDELNIDMAPDGRIYGIELLTANNQLFLQDAGNLVIEDRLSGSQRTLPLIEKYVA